MALSAVDLVSFNGNDGANPFSGLTTDAKGDLFGTTANGVLNGSGRGTVFEIYNTGTAADPIYAPNPTTLVSFNGPDGSNPVGNLIVDANGDLFGTTNAGGADGDGTAFEIVNTGTVDDPIYASTPTTLVSFNGADGAVVYGGLITDANGDLFGTTRGGGADSGGTVFEIANTGTAADPIYASTPTTLVSFNGPNDQGPQAGLIADANGDLFGTTLGDGANGDGTVFEIAKTASGYASTPTTLVTFNGANGKNPSASLIADAKGDLFGTTFEGGGTNGVGTVFEIVNTGTAANPVYASTPTTLATFNSTGGSAPTDPNGAFLNGSLIMDANGDLFGTTEQGGTQGVGDGTVFEIVNTGTAADPVYSSAPITLVTFNNTDGNEPLANVILNAGYLLGTTLGGGPDNDGTAFEINFAPAVSNILWFDPGTGDVGYNNGPNTPWHDLGEVPGGYTVAATGDFDGSGNNEILWFDAATGDVGYNQGPNTTWHDLGAVPSGYTVAGTGPFAANGTVDILWFDAATGDVGYNQGPETPWHDLGAVPSGYTVAATGDFDGSSNAEILWFDASTGDVGYNQGPETTWHDLGAVPGGYTVAGTGNFAGNGTLDILWFDPTTGDVGYNQGPETPWHDLGAVPSGYTVAGVGDFDGNSNAEILWYNAGTGDVGYNQGPNTTWHDLGAVPHGYIVAAV